MIEKELINYVNWKAICKDHYLFSGDISLEQTVELENIIQDFINQNK